MSDDRSTTPSWWQTVPGILTGVAAIITAVTGLIVAFNHTGNRSEEARTSSVATAGASPPASSHTEAHSPAAIGAAGGTQPVNLPRLNRVRLAGGNAVITVLSAQVEPIDADRRSLMFMVRYMNAGRYPANFWSDSYRLIVDDVPRAPTNLLDEVVASDSAKEGEVIFELPVSAKDAVLQISSGDEKSRVPFKLP